MKKIKTFERFISESFTNLEIGQLETTLTKWQEEYFKPKNETDPYLTFNIEPNQGYIEYGYSGREDSYGMSIDLDIQEDMITASINIEGYDSESGEYDKKETKNFTDIEELIKYLKEEIVGQHN